LCFLYTDLFYFGGWIIDDYIYQKWIFSNSRWTAKESYCFWNYCRNSDYISYNSF